MGTRQWASFGLLAAAAIAAPCWAGEGSAEGAAEDAPRYRLIGKNETLWGIALETTPPGRVSASRYMLAIERMNPGAFLNGDIDRLMAGYRLRLPSEAEALALTAEAEPPPALSEPEASPNAAQEDAEVAAAEPEAVPEDALASAEPSLEAEPAATSGAGLSETSPDAVPEEALSGAEPGLEAESAVASGAEPAEIELDAVPEDALSAADLLERLTEATRALLEPQISTVMELLADLRVLWARDPSTTRTIAIMAAMAIIVLFFIFRRRRAGAPRPSQAVSAGPRAGRSFAPPAASAAGQALPEEFPEELSPASGIALQFPEEPDPTGLKLQLAEAYLGLGDAQGAEDLLEEVLAEGDAEQCRQAETLAERLP